MADDGLLESFAKDPELPESSDPLVAEPSRFAGRYAFGTRHHPVPGADNWYHLGQLVLLLLLATLGTMTNICTISCCVVGDRLRKKGNIFIVNLSLVMLTSTLVVLPSLAFHIMSGAVVDNTVCAVHELLVWLSGCVALFTCLAAAVESYLRTFRHQLSCSLVKWWPFVVLAFVWLLGGALYIILLFSEPVEYSCASALIGYWLSLSTSHARQLNNIVLLTVIGGATGVTGAIYLQIWLRLRRPRCCACACHGSVTGGARAQQRVAPWDRQITRANAAVWLSFAVCWLPAACIHLSHPYLAPPGRFLAVSHWPPLLHAALYNLCYLVFSEDFRESFINLLRYCCCKVSVDFTKRMRSDIPRPTLSETRRKPLVATATGRGQHRGNYRIQTSVTCARASASGGGAGGSSRGRSRHESSARSAL